MSSKLKFLISLIFLLFVATQINYGQAKGKIKGKVIDLNSGDPLIGANIMIQGTSVGAAVDLEGKFVIANVEPGSYTLKITYVGYKPRMENITVLSNRSTEITVKLEWIAVEGKTVLVTAQAKGQLSAINNQLSSDEIKNVVSKDRIRELPDANAAESVGRLPGVSVLRSGGEGDKVVIRGLQPKYSKIMVDGVSLSATGSGDRSVSMNMISSYSLEGIEVIKSPTANMDGDQVGGSVNFVMRTAPKGFNYDVVTQGTYNSLRTGNADYTFVAGISNRFFNDKLGVFAQFTTDSKDLSSNEMTAGYSQISQTDNLDPLRITSVTLRNIFRNRVRYGGTFTLDYILPNGKIYFKNFVSSGNTTRQRYREAYGSSHTFQTADDNSSRLIYSNILSYEQYVSIFKINAKVSHSYSGSKTPNSIGFSFGGGKPMTSFPFDTAPENVPGYDTNSTRGIIWQSFWDAESENSGRNIMAKLDFETDFSISNDISGKIKFGGKFRYDERSYDYNGYRGYPSVVSGADYKEAIFNQVPSLSGLPANTTQIPYSVLWDKGFEHGEFLNGDFKLGEVADIDVMHHILDVMREVYYKKLAANPSYPGIGTYQYQRKSSVINDYSGLERYGAGYIMAEINLGKKLKFLPGFRYESKTTSYSGVWGKSGSFPERVYLPNDTTSNRSNHFFLPMIHLRYEPFKWMQVRLAYTQTIARPNFNHILPNMDISDARITMKNPNLRPEQAESFDMYFSFSENHLGLLTIGGFYKNIKDKIFSRGDRFLLTPAEYGIDSLYAGTKFRTQENNNDIAFVKGFEIDWQTNFWYLPSLFKGFIFNINYTKIFSKVSYPRDKVDVVPNPDYFRGCGCPRTIKRNIDGSYQDRLQNQPDDILNFAIGYDYKGFSSRLSMNYSSDIFVSTNFDKELRTLTEAFTRWDLAFTQKLPWYRLQLYCNLTNLTGAVDRQYRFSGHRPSYSSFYGSTISLGLRWRSN